MERAIILAAGRGERLVNGKPYPKPLKPVNGVPLIARVLHGLERAGIDQVTIVVGYLGETLKQGLREFRFELDLRFVENPEFHKPNGTSLLHAKAAVRGPTYLLMSDHLWSPDLIERVRRYPLADDEAVLGIDFKVDACFDLDDATKVAIRGDRVEQIGKELTHYDALDTGVFRITPAVIEALERVDGPQGCSLSQGIGELARAGRMRVVDVEDAAWIDVDTPAALAHAEQLLRRFGRTLRARARPAAASRMSAE
jgi:choline kinase